MGKVSVFIFFLILVPGVFGGIADWHDDSVKFGNIEGGEGGSATVVMPEKVESKVDVKGQHEIFGAHHVEVGHDGRVVHIHQGGNPPVFPSGSKLSIVSSNFADIAFINVQNTL